MFRLRVTILFSFGGKQASFGTFVQTQKSFMWLIHSYNSQHRTIHVVGLILTTYRSSKLEKAFLVAFTRFTQRILAIVNCENHPNLLCLLTETVKLLKDRKDLHEISRLARMNDLLLLAGRKYIGHEFLIQLEAIPIVEDDEATNASLQIAVITTFSNILAAHYSSSTVSSNTTSLSSHSWSPLQVLAKACLFGTQLIMEAISHYNWIELPLTVRALLGFQALRDKTFVTARQILEPAFKNVFEEYGKGSKEYIVVGTQLVLCYNALAMESDAAILTNDMVAAIWSNRNSGPIDQSDVLLVRSTQDIYLLLAYSDSLIGQGLYQLAKQLLFCLAEHKTSKNPTTLLCILRILKINRRQQGPDSDSHSWTMLERAVRILEHAPNDLLYQCFEEATSMLSAINSLDTAQIARSKNVIDALDTVDLSRFDGPKTMRLTLHDYQQELRAYRKHFGLFSVTGPQLHYCHKIREAFPKASMAIVERIAAANWERFQRLKEMPSLNEGIEPVITIAPSIFHDSGLGTSLQTPTAPVVVKSPRSRLSMNTAPGPGLSGVLEVPPEIMAGKPYQCEWCGRSLKLKNPKQEWP